MIAKAQYEDKSLAGNYNVGPDDMDCWTTGNLVNLFCQEWQEETGQKISWINENDQSFHEANFLKLDNTKIKATFNWKPTWNIETSIKKSGRMVKVLFRTWKCGNLYAKTDWRIPFDAESKSFYIK